jgi:hypothetical protein
MSLVTWELVHDGFDGGEKLLFLFVQEENG